MKLENSLGAANVRIDGPNSRQIPGNRKTGDADAQPGKTKGSQESGPTGRGVAVEPTVMTYVRKAIESDQIDLQAVAEAKKLLESGELDTAETAERAAERIIDLGI